MPVIKSAKKMMRVAERRAAENELVRRTFKHAVKAARTEANPKTLATAQGALMKAAKNNVIHKNKASRLIARLAKQQKAA